MDIVSRARWGATAALGPAMRLPARELWLHHSVTTATGTPAADMRTIERIGVQRFGRFSYCVDDQTCILTSEGWKSYDSLTMGEDVLTLNHVTGLAEWQPLTAVHIFPPEPREMLLMRTHAHSSLTTLDHRWPVERSRFLTGYKAKRDPATGRFLSGQGPRPRNEHVVDRCFATSKRLTTSDRIVLGAPLADRPTHPKYSDALVESLAWFWTEGHIFPNGQSCNIVQSVRNASNVARIRSALTALLGPAVEHMPLGVAGRGRPMWREGRQGDIALFYLSADAGLVLLEHAPGRLVSYEFLRSLTSGQLELFIDVSLRADGSSHEQLSQKSRAMAERFQFACILSGRPASLHPRPPTPTTRYPMWTVGVRRRDRLWVRRTRREIVSYEGTVWCPQTPNGTWLAQRDGTVWFTGNSYAVHPSGTVLEGAGTTVGAHTGGRNSTSFGIVWIGNYEIDRPSRAQIDATAELIRHLVATGRVVGRPPLGGHRDVKATACPGRHAYSTIPEIRGLAGNLGGPGGGGGGGATGSPLLRRGSTGTAVREWQRILVGAGLLGAADMDGIFGPKTEAATREFQQALRVAADGIVGPETWDATRRLLDWLAGGGAAAPGIPAFPGTVRLGSRGTAVRQVQQRLRDRGWTITVDGVFGSGTDQVVRAFQREKGLVVDGVVGPATWHALWATPIT